MEKADKDENYRMIRITDLNAPEVAIYTGLNEKQVKRIYEPETGLFICESVRVIERAITASYDVMKHITGYSLTGGVLAAMRRKALPELSTFLQSHQRIVVLDDVENPTNVGAVFRSAAALGADGIVLTQGSADPLYRRAIRVSMGAVFQIAWTYADHALLPLVKESGSDHIVSIPMKHGVDSLNVAAARTIAFWEIWK